MIKLFQIENDLYDVSCLWRKSYPMHTSVYFDTETKSVVDNYELTSVCGLSNFSTAKEYFRNFFAHSFVCLKFNRQDMTKETKDYRRILCGNRLRPLEVWLPKKIIEVSECPETPSLLSVKMPRWLFRRTPFFDWLNAK